jgi:2-oxoacid:acceptor oxidoreductase delta subunit (pyruvate/2-ketoisovalerate family)
MLEESSLRYERVRGIPHIRDPGNAQRRNTGAWRVFRPVWDYSKCVKCKRCWLYCPEAAIAWKGKPMWLPRVCKGCMVCVEVCPAKAITKVREHHK